MGQKSNMAAVRHLGLGDANNSISDSEHWGLDLSSCIKDKNRHRNEQSLGSFNLFELVVLSGRRHLGLSVATRNYCQKLILRRS